MTSMPPAEMEVDPQLRARLDALIHEGWEIFHRFDLEVRRRHFHPFIAGDYERVLQALLAFRAPGRRFLELGSASGVITIMADMLGFEACGIELDAPLVDVARDLAARHGSRARFEAGSFLPAGYRWRPADGDGRSGTIGDGSSAYPKLGRALEDFDLVYGYPWIGEEPMMLDLMRTFGRRGATMLLHGTEDVDAYVDGKRIPR